MNTCPYCRDDKSLAHHCPKCLAPLHVQCWQENRNCCPACRHQGAPKPGLLKRKAMRMRKRKAMRTRTGTTRPTAPVSAPVAVRVRARPSISSAPMSPCARSARNSQAVAGHAPSCLPPITISPRVVPSGDGGSLPDPARETNGEGAQQAVRNERPVGVPGLGVTSSPRNSALASEADREQVRRDKEFFFGLKRRAVEEFNQKWGIGRELGANPVVAAPEPPALVFQAALDHIQSMIRRPISYTWFRDLQFLGVEENVVRIGAPNKFVKEWIEGSDLIDTLAAAVSEAYDRPLTPKLILTEPEEDEFTGDLIPQAPVAAEWTAETPDPLFQAVLDHIQSKIKRAIFDTWFRNLHFLGVDENVIRIGTPNKFVKEWIDGSDLIHTLAAGVREAYDRSLTPKLILTEPEEDEFTEDPFSQAPVALADSPVHMGLVRGSSVQLNDDYIFKSYIVGPNNRLAHAASMAVGEAPGQTYNPLYIHSGAGMHSEKEHLLHAICHALMSKNRAAKILYLSCEDFVNRFIEAVKDGELEQFRYKYRNVDVLVIDDLHFLADKERIQEEFFHTFNTLYNAQKQIILSADCSPSEIPTLADRLVSRFEWGLVTRIDPPVFETRAAIIKQKAEAKGYDFDDDVVKFLASPIDSNIREIEGAINRLVGTASLMNRRIDLTLAQQILADLGSGEVTRVQIQDICEAVVNRFKVKLSDMQSRKHATRIAIPRRICMYLARDLTDLTLAEIGGHFGDRDYTAVIYAIERIEERSSREPELAQLLEELKRDSRLVGNIG
jgi:chromosomal replication initiator protein